MSFIVLKFGGTSVASSQNIKKVEQIILSTYQQNPEIAIVVSAFGNLKDEPKITDLLIQTGELAAIADQNYKKNIEIFKQKHLTICKELKLSKSEIEEVKSIFQELERILEGVFLMQEMTVRTLDFLMSFGERLSAFIISKYLNKSDFKKGKNIDFQFLDARKVILTDSNFGSSKVDFEATNQKIQEIFQPQKTKDKKIIYIITGFIAANSSGQTTTLGRGGSDYTAAIFGAGLKANQIQIWTDVNGVLTSDPRKVKKAFSLENLSYDEAMEVSHFGAKVIYPPTIEPAKKKNIPVVIKNTFNPKHSGTIINDDYKPKENYPFLIKGVTSLSDLSLLRLQGIAFTNKYDISARLFNILAVEKIDIILISRSSSQFSICLAIKKEETAKATKIINKEFAPEINYGSIDPVKIQKDVVVIAVIGENMRHRPGASSKVFSALGKNGINVIAISQGSNEINISTVIDKKHQDKALKAIHDEFFSLQKNKTLNLFIAGASGLIGSELITQILSQKEILSQKNNLDLNIVAISNSKRMCLDNADLNLELNGFLKKNSAVKNNFKEKTSNFLEKNGVKNDLNKFIKNAVDMNLPNSIFVDCTTSYKVAGSYDKFLEKSIAVVTPNKKAASGDYKYFKKLKELAKIKNTHYHFETNVGAGLPVISVLNDLIQSGDEILKIEGVLSGTLSYLFNQSNSKTKFSQILKLAQKQGYTEPDPRDDLSGMDVARKILILSREAVLGFEMNDIQLESAIEKEFFKDESLEKFYEKLETKFDEKFAKKLEKLEKENKRLRYLAILQNTKKGFELKVELQEVDNSHPSYSLNGSENIIIFWTARYNQSPLVIKGPGAGAGVTAAGIFADIIACRD